MSILVLCSCGRKLKVSDTCAGRRIRCPHCSSAVKVPSSAEDAAFQMLTTANEPGFSSSSEFNDQQPLQPPPAPLPEITTAKLPMSDASAVKPKSMWAWRLGRKTVKTLLTACSAAGLYTGIIVWSHIGGGFWGVAAMVLVIPISSLIYVFAILVIIAIPSVGLAAAISGVKRLFKSR